MRKIKSYLVTIIIIIALSGIMINIFENIHFSESILVNNVLWGILTLLLMIGQLTINFKAFKKIEKIINKMANGDLTRKITYKNNSFFKNLCLDINMLLIKVRKLINESTTMTDKVISHCEDLSKNAKLAETAANETHSNIIRVSADMMEQMNSTLETEKTAYEIIDEYKEIVSQGSSIESMAISMSNIVRESTKIYDDLIMKLNDSATSNISLASKIKGMSEKIYKIQSIADKVNNISRTMNILSLNASIEAARANEAGLSFAVVAKDVRDLSSNSALQAKEIESIINEIKNEITDVALQMASEVEIIHKNIEFSNVTKENLNKIFTESQNTLLSVHGINRIIDAQDKKMSDIKNAIVKIAKISGTTTAATQQISASSDEQLTAMKNVFNAISNLITMNRDLKDNLESFAQNFKITKELQKYINDGENVLIELAANEALSGMDYHTCTNILVENKRKQPYFELFGLIDKSGLRKAITLDYKEEEVYVDFSHRPYFKEAIKGNKYKSEPYISADTNNYCIAISVPVKNTKGDIAGVLIGDLTLG